MKTILFISFLFFFTGHSISQQTYDFFGANPEYNTLTRKPIWVIPEKNIIAIQYQVTRGKKKPQQYRKTYLDSGLINSFSVMKKSGWQYKNLVEFDENKNPKAFKSYRNGVEQESVRSVFRKDGKQLSREVLNKSGKRKHKVEWQYTEDGCVSRMKFIKSNGELKEEWVHSYYANCERKSSQLIKGNGQVKKTVSYECKQEGEVLSPRKDETQICKWDEETHDRLIKIAERYDEKGRLTRTVTTYQKSDTTLLERKSFDEKERLKFEGRYDHHWSKPLLFVGYKSGKETYRTEFQYENDRVVETSSSYKTKPRAKYMRVYNDSGQLVSYQWLNGKGKLREEITLTYEF